MKKILLLIFTLFSALLIAQKTDTIIDGAKYTVLTRHSNGFAKDIGQHGVDCDSQIRKHGIFISYSKKGKEVKRKVYSMGSRRNHSFLFLKVGWWGFGSEELYFLGIPLETRIVCPCYS
jgi:hypothetical protein